MLCHIIQRRLAVLVFLSCLLILSFRPTSQADEATILYLNEIMYHPIAKEATNEWIELYNPTSSPIDVNGWKIFDGQEKDTIQGDPDHGDGGTIIPPHGYAILVDQGTELYENSVIPEDAVRLSVDDSTLCGYGLNNNNEKLLLFSNDELLIDAVEWGTDDEEVPGSPSPIVQKGNSLARYPGVDSDDSFTDFFECTTPTPGTENILEIEPEEIPDENESTEESTSYPPLALITELYYYTHANLNNEFVTLTNPTTRSITLTGWYLTDEPWKDVDDQAKLLFPDQAILPPQTSWYITQNASAFLQETGRLPDYEYKVDARPDVPQMNTYKKLTFSNTGGVVALVDDETTSVDVVVYGDTEYAPFGWDSSPIPASGSGVILKRTLSQGVPVDTNTASDWLHPRIYGMGQSDFPVQTISFTGEITTFVSPDCSYDAITSELEKATHSIYLNIYEFTNPFLCETLITALNRNVSVCVFLEGSPIGGIDVREQYLVTTIADHGGRIRFLVSDTKHDVHARYRFDHAKYLIIDNTTVIVESCNWAKTGVPKNPTYGNREWGIIIRNTQVAAAFLQIFYDDWNPQRSDSYPLEAMNFLIPSDFKQDTTIPTGSYPPRFSSTTHTITGTVTPIFSPDTSEQLLCDTIDTATNSIYIEQLYIYKNWSEQISPLLQHLINKSNQGVDIKVILDYNTGYTDTVVQLNETKSYLEDYGIQVHFISSEWSPFTTVHNKGMIIDNRTVLISSINWNEQSVRGNRESGVLIENDTIARYYADVFFSDWALSSKTSPDSGISWAEYKNPFFIALVIGVIIALIIHDWRKRKW